jgi:hypothetical protein
VFELCDLIVSAVNAASQDAANFGAFKVAAELDPAATLVLEEAFEDVRVLVTPVGKTGGPQTLDGKQERTFTIAVVISARVDAPPTAEAVRQLDALGESISAVIAEDVMLEMDGLEWDGENGEPLYDHDKLRDKAWYQCELTHSWTLNGSE